MGYSPYRAEFLYKCPQPFLLYSKTVFETYKNRRLAFYLCFMTDQGFSNAFDLMQSLMQIKLPMTAKPIFVILESLISHHKSLMTFLPLFLV